MTFPNHVTGRARNELGRKWGRASAQARERQRTHALPDGETLHRRALADARGQIVRAPCVAFLLCAECPIAPKCHPVTKNQVFLRAKLKFGEVCKGLCD